MARNKNPNIINVQEAREFMHEAYGLSSKIMTPYELMIIQEEFLGKFHWYHTTGKLLCITKKRRGDGQNYDELKRCLTDEDVALEIQKFVYDRLKNKGSRFYWDKSHKIEHRSNLKKLQAKIQTTHGKVIHTTGEPVIE